MLEHQAKLQFSIKCNWVLFACWAGASGAIAVVVVDLVKENGEQYLPYCVILGGLICLVFATFRCANLMILISTSVMIGFVNGLALIQGFAQV